MAKATAFTSARDIHNGTHGDTIYTEFQYSADGTNWHDQVAAGDTYIRTRTVTNGVAGNWGTATNLKGDTGDDGDSYTGTTEYYKLTNSTTAPTIASGSWLTTPQFPTSSNQYLWNYNVNTRTIGGDINSPVSLVTQYVEDGVGISSIGEGYAKSSSGTTAPTSWGTYAAALPLSDTSPYLWNKTTTTYTDATTTSTSTIIAIKGIDADALTVSSSTTNGVTTLTFSDNTTATINDGATGTASGVKIIYASDTSGTGASFTQGSLKYANYYEWTGSAPTTVPSGLTYTLFIGEDGDNAGVVPVYADDASGTNKSLTDSSKDYVNFYEWTGTAPTTPPTGLTYVQFVGDDGATPVKGADYFDGTGRYVSYVFKTGTSAPSTPTTGSYNGTAETVPNNWSDDPVYTAGNITWVSKATYVQQLDSNGGASTTWNRSSWSTPAKFYEKGEDGVTPDALTVSTSTTGGVTTLTFSDGTTATVDDGVDGTASGVKIIYASDTAGTGASFTQGSLRYANYYEWTGSAPTTVPSGLTYTLFIGEDGDNAGVVPVYADNASGTNASLTDSSKDYVNFYEWTGTAPTSPPTGLTYVQFVGDDGADGYSNLLRADDNWVIGTGGTQGVFSKNGATDENDVVLGESPLGGSEAIWHATGGNTSSDGGWNAVIYDIDHSRTYRNCVWIKSTGTDLSNYLGCSGSQTNSLNGTANTNPYHWHGDLPTMNKWYLVVGIIHGSGYSGSASGLSGVYDPESGLKVVSGTDFKNKTTATTQKQRVYRYYVTTPSHESYFARPRFEVVNGEEPSLQELLGRRAVDGDSSYLHVKYSEDGTTFTGNNGEDLGRYIGTYVDTNDTDSSTFTDYTWALFNPKKGTDYDDGIRGPFVATVTNTLVNASNSSGSSLPDTTDTSSQEWTDSGTIYAGAGIGERVKEYVKSEVADGILRNYDQVTVYNTTNQWSATRYYDGTYWQLVEHVIDGNLLVDGSIGAASIAAGAISANEIAAGTITANELASDSVTSDKIIINDNIAFDQGAAGIVFGKTSLGDTADGSFYGRGDNGVSGFYVSSSSAGIYADSSGLLTLQNVKIFTGSAGAKTEFYTVGTHTANLSTLSTHLSIEIIGSGGGASTNGVPSKWSGSGVGGSAGATTYLYFYDDVNGTGTLLDTESAAGGAAVAHSVGSNYDHSDGTAGESTAQASGGAGGVKYHDETLPTGTQLPSAGSKGSGGGGGGAQGHNSSRNAYVNAAAKKGESNSKTMAIPSGAKSVKVVIPAGGAGGVPTTGTIFYVDGVPSYARRAISGDYYYVTCGGAGGPGYVSIADPNSGGVEIDLVDLRNRIQALEDA